MPVDSKLKNLILKKAEQKLSQQIKWRRYLHQYPELSAEEYKTTEYLKKLAKRFGLSILPTKLETGFIAELKGKGKGKTVAVRTDIDALPITEMTSVPFKSKIPGKMHACGHDVHMSVILGTAAILKELGPHLQGVVRFIFQPAEEQPPGGAGPMIAAGALKDVSMIFALHVDPHLATGKISLRDGPSMGAVMDFDLIIHGTGGHAARPHTGIDAIVTAADVINSIQKIVSREIDPIDPVVISFGKVAGGAARNVLCDRVELTGTARTLSKEVARKLPGLIKRSAEAACRARGARLEMKRIAGYPLLSNHAGANRVLSRNFETLFGPGKVEKTELVLGSEDFACYLQKTKGAMFRLGVMNKRLGADQAWHSPLFAVDERAIYYGTALLAAAVADYLG